jgi:hypothetical protein
MIVPAHARRRVEPVGAQSFDLPPAQESIDEGETPGIVGAEALRNQGRRSRGDRLRRGSLLARSVACRRRAFHDREDGAAGRSIEHEDEPHLGRDHHHRQIMAVALDRSERGLRGHVVVPYVVVCGLKAPDQLPRRAVQRDDRGR